LQQVDRAATKNLPSDFAPLELLQAALNKWWLVSLLTLLGGLVGWVIYLFQPPIYEARASILVSVDFSNTGMLTQFEEDLMMDAVGNLLRSNDVIQRVVERAARQGLQVNSENFFSTAFLERRLGTWELRVRDASPQSAAVLANIWLEEGYSVLSGAYQHAVSAQALTRHLSSLERCLQHAATSETSAYFCNGQDLPAIQSELQETAGLLAAEQLASRGILAGTVLGPPQEAAPPGRPLAASRGLIILAGALVGLLLGFMLGQIDLPFSRRG
jgi:hypothetical protein